MKIIINADDFGLSHEVNAAIAEAFSRGYITNTTIMSNMESFGEAVVLSREHGFFDKVGLHLNFFEGVPLTEAMQAEEMFMRDGKMLSDKFFHEVSKKNEFFLPKHTTRALRGEAEAQIERYLAAGFPELHIDSHGHSHTVLSIFRAARKPIREGGFRSIRLSLNLFAHPRSLLVRLYKKYINRCLKRKRKTTTYFTSANEFIERAKQGLQNDATYEIMVHPVYQNGELKNAGGADFETLLSHINREDLICYAEL